VIVSEIFTPDGANAKTTQQVIPVQGYLSMRAARTTTRFTVMQFPFSPSMVSDFFTLPPKNFRAGFAMRRNQGRKRRLARQLLGTLV
jgi:hypothetical protein